MQLSILKIKTMIKNHQRLLPYRSSQNQRRKWVSETLKQLPTLLTLKEAKAFWAVESNPILTLVGHQNELQLGYEEYLHLLANRLQILAENEEDLEERMNLLIPPRDRMFNLETKLKEGSLGTTLLEMCLDSWEILSQELNQVQFPIQLKPNKNYETTFNESTIMSWLNEASPVTSER